VLFISREVLCIAIVVLWDGREVLGVCYGVRKVIRVLSDFREKKGKEVKC
jgi:hypothetical protein